MKGNYLTPKQELFVRAYVTCLNASEAAKKAGFSQHSAGRYCLELLMKPHIQDAIQRYRRKFQQKLDISFMRVIQEYISVGMSNIKNIVDQDPATKKITVKDLSEMPDHVTASIASLETREGIGRNGRPEQRVRVTFWPKVPALESLCKSLGYDKASLEKELVAIENQNGPEEQTTLDPKTFTKEQWTVFKELNAKRLEGLKP